MCTEQGRDGFEGKCSLQDLVGLPVWSVTANGGVCGAQNHCKFESFMKQFTFFQFTMSIISGNYFWPLWGGHGRE